jgi:hypothetical protein
MSVPANLLALSDDALEAAMSACQPLRPSDRSAFLQSVAAELAKYPMVGPGIIARVCAQTQRKFFDPPNLNGAGKYG